jgi:hypothetical protein
MSRPHRSSTSSSLEVTSFSVTFLNTHVLTMNTDHRDHAAPSQLASVTSLSIGHLTTNTHDNIRNRPRGPTTSQGFASAPLHIAKPKSKAQKFASQSRRDDSGRFQRSSESQLVDRTKSTQVDSSNGRAFATSSRRSSCTSANSVPTDDEEISPNVVAEAVDAMAPRASPPTRKPLPLNSKGDTERHGIGAAEVDTGSGLNSNSTDMQSEPSNKDHSAGGSTSHITAPEPRPSCTSKHFRVRCITGRDSIDGDTYYVVSWKSSWVPSDMIFTSEDGQERYIKIDGKDWRIARTIKAKVKKDISKELVRWVDDTLEPVKRLRRAIPAIIDFELKPRLNRRVVSFDESLIDLTKILPQSNEDFLEAQVHLASKWPMIEPRNDIDLLPAFRQIMLEQFPRRDDETANRKTHQRLIDQPQLRHLCWSEEYLLSGRFYECTLPKRNALLLQVVAEGVDDGWCERCVTVTAPFKECARDITDESPWLNGACANCGTAEANSTCCHHLFGTAHLERGRSSGLTSERLREFINPTRSIELLKRLEYEKDDDSDTYSADSYAESDNSSVYEHAELDDGHGIIHDDDVDGQNGESTINNFWTPDVRSEDMLDSVRQRSAMSSGDGSGGLFPSPAIQSVSLSEAAASARLPECSIFRGAAALPTPDVTQARRVAAIASSSGTRSLRDATWAEPVTGNFDRSSVTMAAGSPESEFTNINAPGHSNRHRLGRTDHLSDHGNMCGNVGSLFVQDSTAHGIWPGNTASPGSFTTTGSRAVAMQSVETFGRTFATHSSDINAPSSEGPGASLLGRKGRKRAASQPSEHEPATYRASTDSSRSSRGTSNHVETDAESHLAKKFVKKLAEPSTGSKIDRGSTHEGCRANWPCMHPDNTTPDNETSVAIFRDAVDASYQLSIGEVRYILSRCTCHWASAFTKVWDGWCEIEGTPADADLAKPQFLLSNWTEFLLEAAKECCPTDPNNRVIINID